MVDETPTKPSERMIKVCPDCKTCNIKYFNHGWHCYTCPKVQNTSNELVSKTFQEPILRKFIVVTDHGMKQKPEDEFSSLPSASELWELATKKFPVEECDFGDTEIPRKTRRLAFKNWKILAFICLAYLTGSRVSELLAVRLQDLVVVRVREQDFLNIRLQVLKKKGKKKFFRSIQIPCDDFFVSFLISYAIYLKQHAVLSDEDIKYNNKNNIEMTFFQAGYLFDFSRKTAWKYLNNLVWEGKPLYVHFIRHLTTSHLALKGLSLKQQQNFFQWSSPKIALVYHFGSKQDVLQKLFEGKFTNGLSPDVTRADLKSLKNPLDNSTSLDESFQKKETKNPGF